MKKSFTLPKRYEKKWEILHEVLPATCKRASNKQANSEDGNKACPADKAKKFNDFFYTVGEKLTNDIPNVNSRDFKNYMTNRVSESMYLEPRRCVK